MFLKLTPATTPHWELSTVSLPGGMTQVWPAEQPLVSVGDPSIHGTVFQDTHLWNESALARVSSEALRLPPTLRGLGGKKVRDLETWNMPGFQLLMQRALLMFCKVHNCDSAHVLDRWINVMVAGDYSVPHCHYDAQSAVVFTLDRGEEVPAEPMDGNFELIDSRIGACCPYQPLRPMRGLSPCFRAGMMLLFPAEYVHFVHPYSGKRPRVTVAWNISAGPPPSDRVIDPTQPVPLQSITGVAR